MANKEVEWQFMLDKVCHALISQLKIVTPALTELHWLPITARVQYKLCLLVHSAAVGTAPDYLKNMLQDVSDRASQRTLRSATNNDIAVPCSRLMFGKCAFSIATPRAWNSIPADLRATLNTVQKDPEDFYFVNLIRHLDLTRLTFAVLRGADVTLLSTVAT